MSRIGSTIGFVLVRLLDLFRHTWVRITLSNVLIGLAGLFTNLLSSDIYAAPNSAWYEHFANRYVLALLIVLALNTWMQIRLEPSSGYRTQADFRETLRRGVSDELITAMRDVIRGGEHQFISAEEVKTILGLDDE